VVRFGFTLMTEQSGPKELIRYAVAAEEVGFDSEVSSDHYSPWLTSQGHASYAWSVLGAVAQATNRVELATYVTCPTIRYHPAVVAQKAATLQLISDGRFILGLGSGENLNEHVTGDRWPDKPIRDARLVECAAVIRRLLDGEEVSHDGLVRVDRAKVWSCPADPPPVLGAAVSASTAASVAAWADGLITVAGPRDELRTVVDAFRAAGGEDKPVHLQVHLSWATDEQHAHDVAFDQWRSNVGPSSLAWNLELPEQFDALGEFVRPEDVSAVVRTSSDLGRHVGWIEELLELEPDGIFLHHVGRDQRAFIEAFGCNVLPRLVSR
jgi:probable non-F420 flavinoid oxidoreductase